MHISREEEDFRSLLSWLSVILVTKNGREPGLILKVPGHARSGAYVDVDVLHGVRGLPLLVLGILIYVVDYLHIDNAVVGGRRGWTVLLRLFAFLHPLHLHCILLKNC